jgi:Fur family ferric uptake transcriptional regulator
MKPAKRRRHTPQRQVILEELRLLHSHPTAAELYERVRMRLPRISLGTVYRNLEVLCEDGMARRLTLAGADARYDGVTTRHDHVRCSACGCLRDLEGDEVPPHPTPPLLAGGFRIEGCRLEYFGLCPDCQEAEALARD